MKKIAFGLKLFFSLIYIPFEKLISVNLTEFCHQINFDGNELFVRHDTLFQGFFHKKIMLFNNIRAFKNIQTEEKGFHMNIKKL